MAASLYSILVKQEQAHEDSIWSCAWKQSEKDRSENIITAGIDDVVKIWRWTDEKLDLKHELEGHQLGIVSVDMNQNGTLAASSSLDSHVRVWDVDTGKCIKSMDAGPVDAWTIAFSPDSKYLASGSHNGKINLFGIESGRKEHTMDTRGKFTMSIAYSVGEEMEEYTFGYFFATLNGNGRNSYRDQMMSPDGRYIASGAIDGIINIFDVDSGKLIHTLEGHAMPIRSLCFSPDSQLLVTGSDDNQIKIYDVQHANPAGTLSGHGSWVLSVDFCPDNTHFVSSSSDKTVKIWNSGSRQCVHTFYDHSDQVWSAKYNHNGTKIVSVSDDRAVDVYDCPPL